MASSSAQSAEVQPEESADTQTWEQVKSIQFQFPKYVLPKEAVDDYLQTFSEFFQVIAASNACVLHAA